MPNTCLLNEVMYGFASPNGESPGFLCYIKIDSRKTDASNFDKRMNEQDIFISRMREM